MCFVQVNSLIEVNLFRALHTIKAGLEYFTYPCSLNFSTSSAGLLPPISKICLDVKNMLIVKSAAFYGAIYKSATFQSGTFLFCTHVNSGNFSINISITSLICRASSRVGVITRAPTYRKHPNFSKDPTWLSIQKSQKPKTGFLALVSWLPAFSLAFPPFLAAAL